MKFSRPILLGFLIPVVSAHFSLVYPDSRKRVEQNMPDFPCGGSPQSENRTLVSLSDGSFPVALRMGHSRTAIEMLLSLGTDPGDNFNITLVPTFGLEGLGEFCIPHVSFDPAVLGTRVTDGMNATLQVQSNGDPSGGLYACADIQFSSTATYSEPSSCKNNTGVSAIPFTAQLNANESTAEGKPQQAQSSTQSPTSSLSPSATGSSDTSPTSSTGGAVPLQTAAWGLLGAAIAGGIAVL